MRNNANNPSLPVPPQSIGTCNGGTPCIDKVLSKERELRGDTASGNSALWRETVSRRQKSSRKSVRIFIALTHYGVTDCGVARELQVRQPMNEPRCKDVVDLQRIERVPDSPLSFPLCCLFFFSFSPASWQIKAIVTSYSRPIYLSVFYSRSFAKMLSFLIRIASPIRATRLRFWNQTQSRQRGDIVNTTPGKECTDFWSKIRLCYPSTRYFMVSEWSPLFCRGSIASECIV